jgi:exodeoxyribonuclease VII large subunit
VLADPRHLLDVRADEVSALRERARRTFTHRLDRAADDVAHHRARARALSPLATLQRGYAVVQDAEGHVLTSTVGVEAGAELTVRLADGRLPVTAGSAEQDVDQTPGTTGTTPGANDG